MTDRAAAPWFALVLDRATPAASLPDAALLGSARGCFVNIAELTNADVEAVVALWRYCELTRPWNDPHADIAHARRATDAAVLVGHEGGRVVASVMVGFDGHRGWVYYLAVDPDARRRGLGRTMMDAAERWLRMRDAPKLQLMVRNTNTAALGFYERLGFEPQAVVTLGKRLDGREGRG